jgi:hypothetical protein
MLESLIEQIVLEHFERLRVRKDLRRAGSLDEAARMHGDRAGTAIESLRELLGKLSFRRGGEQRAEVARELPVRSVGGLQPRSARLAAGGQLNAIGREAVLEKSQANTARNSVIGKDRE